MTILSKINFTYIISLAFFVLMFSIQVTFAQYQQPEYCFADGGCVNFNTETADAGYMLAVYFDNLDDYLAAAVNYYISIGHTGYYISGADGNTIAVACGNGVSILVTKRSCKNGAINYRTCDICIAGAAMQNGKCKCTNGGTVASQCKICPVGLSMSNGVCACNNATINPPTCNQCLSAATWDGVQCTCSNGALASTNCTVCPEGKSMYNNQCLPKCSLVNVCGQASQGVLVNNICTSLSGSSTNINNSCITNFEAKNPSVNPNGSVEFKWSLANLPSNVGSRCGFVDLTTPTPRPIPGLQNLNPNQDSIKITNIQSSTRFCLICQFYSLLNNSNLGSAASHQWVRVTRVGEN